MPAAGGGCHTQVFATEYAVEDFRDLARAKGAVIERAWFFADETEIGATGANWRAEFAVFELSR